MNRNLVAAASLVMFSTAMAVGAEKVGTSPLTNCSFDASAPSETFDIAIINGRVMDPECNFDGQRNVGIKGNRISVITQAEIKGKRTIDAKGQVVAPGFINTHNHAFSGFDQKMLAHDGITTLLDTEGGVSSPKFFYDKYKDNSFVNYGVGVGHEEVRRVVLDGLTAEQTSDPTNILVARGLAQEDGHASWALDIPTPDQHQEILRMYDQGMRDGAIAVATTVGYMGYGVPTYEVFDLQKLAKKYERFFGAHTRFGPTESLPTNYTLGVREVIANAVALDGYLILSHIQNQNWQESYELARRLQKRGMNIFAEYYPAITGNPNIATPQLLPDKIDSNNIDPTKHIYDTKTGELFETKEAFFKMQEESPDAAIFIIVRDPQWMKEWPHMKDIVIASDAVAYIDEDGNTLPIEAPSSAYGGHPRNAGSMGIVFREAREQNIPLMDIVNNASYVAAKYMSNAGLKPMQERGRLQPGMIADITIFSPDTIADTSTMKIGERGSYTAGIPYVMVNGEVIIDGGVANTELRAGQPIRYDVITEGKIGDVVDLEDKEFQWHSDLPGYPATRFPPNEMNPPSPNELEPENNQASISQPGETKLASQSWKLDVGKDYVDMHYCSLDGLSGGNHDGHDHVVASLNTVLK
jgi:N-acyl-D-amino-acid deacylase